ncbi:NAD(P)/FAD-dependent oxidoreductase [Streptomyces sp. NBS 14/10]|uniref:phytoene desaturase family protein n=1 Tax=Streptomyces sp. NBS 14/10 TaxID=1945643 RepID=UPI000B800AF3|nr:NAD(P)/FAD-dependent oxidoreductase [Streptomyces sp. NBS 14/10]KAK1178539.1 NAD(P)/FAD-dependent oxidoreductase [Streptomyces sp. NBS 14/10]
MARIAVIGAGMGAMAAAARLAVAGHQVAVYERGQTHGGGVGRFERDGFAFDTGPGLLHLPAVYRDLFVKTGKETLEQCVELTQVDPASRHVFADGTDVPLPNASRAGVVRALDDAFGAGAGERWSDLVNRAREAWDATRRPLLEEPLRADWQTLGRDPYPAPVRRGVSGWFRRDGGAARRPAALADVARRELKDPRAVALLESHALAHSLDPRTAPASAAVLPYLEQTFGTWYARGGIRALADAVYERCRARKVRFSFGAEVVGIVEKDGRAAGVELADGSVAEADAVVAGIDPALLPSLLGGAEPWHDGDVRPGGGALGSGPGDGAAGRLTVFLALRGARPEDTAHRTVVHAPDRDAELAAVFGEAAGPGGAGGPGAGLGTRAPCPRPTVTVLRPDDPTTRPDEDHEAVTLTATVAPHGPVDWIDGTAAEEDADRLLAVAEAAIPGLRDRLLWREVRTPADTAADTGATGGAVPGPALAGAEGRFLRPANATRLPGLYLAGGWAHPGGGLAHAGMSGTMVAGLIVGGADWRGSE